MTITPLLMKKIKKLKETDKLPMDFYLLQTFLIALDKSPIEIKFGKAITIKPRAGNQTVLDTVNVSLVGWFAWQYHISKGGTEKNIQQKMKQYSLKNKEKITIEGKQKLVPKLHLLAPSVKKWAGMNDGFEKELYLIHLNHRYKTNLKDFSANILDLLFSL